MKSFKEMLEADLDVFINPDEFADKHTINGTEYDVIVDSESSGKEKRAEYFGVYQGYLTIYVKSSDFGAKPKPETMILFDDIPYNVVDSNDENGMLKIILESSES